MYSKFIEKYSTMTKRCPSKILGVNLETRIMRIIFIEKNSADVEYNNMF